MHRTVRYAIAICLCLLGPHAAESQTKQVVTAAQANGTYRSYEMNFAFSRLGIRKLKVQFDGVYRTISKSVNTGSAEGEAIIDGNVATLDLPEFGPCKINMVFLPHNRLKVFQEGDSPDCGFGHNVRADGTYRKIRERQTEVRAATGMSVSFTPNFSAVTK
jgi:hypothetical protein